MKKFFAFLVVLISIGVLNGCGEVVEQNEVALVLRSLGDRTPETVNVKESAPEAAPEEGQENPDATLDNFSVELITARRAPVQVPGVVVLRFPLGLQSYRFTAKPSLESPENEGVLVDVVGGQVGLEVV